MSRPRNPPRDPVATRARILKAATAEFAGAGFRACSTDDIVDAAGLSRRMLYHYFGDKAGLYREVLRAQWGELREFFAREVASRVETSAPALEVFLELFFDFVASHPSFVRIMMWEGLEGGRFSRSLWREARAPVFAQAQAVIRQAQDDGHLNPALDPAQLIVSLLGATTFYFAYAPTLGDVLGKEPLSPAALSKRKAALLAQLRDHYQ